MFSIPFSVERLRLQFDELGLFVSGVEFPGGGTGFERSVRNWPWPEHGQLRGAEASQAQRAHGRVGKSVSEPRKADPGEMHIDFSMAKALKPSLIVCPSLPCIMAQDSPVRKGQPPDLAANTVFINRIPSIFFS